MRKMALVALLCGGLAPLSTGCVIVEAVDDTITASWNLVSGDTNAPTGCPAGATTVEVVTQDAFGTIIDKFDCVGADTVKVQREPGPYAVWVNVTGNLSTELYAQSLSQTVSVPLGGTVPAGFDISVDRGAFMFEWQITDTGALSSCDTDTPDVSVSTTLYNNANIYYDDEQDCGVYGMTTRGMALGRYILSVSLNDIYGDAVYVHPAIDSSLDWGNHHRDLGLLTLDRAGN